MFSNPKYDSSLYAETSQLAPGTVDRPVLLVLLALSLMAFALVEAVDAPEQTGAAATQMQDTVLGARVVPIADELELVVISSAPQEMVAAHSVQ